MVFNTFSHSKQSLKQKSKVKKSTKHNQSTDSLSTMRSQKPSNFTDVYSSMIKSKVDNIKGSLSCFEMSNNLKDMMELSKCIKWRRRREHRMEMAKNGFDEFEGENDSQSESS